MLKQIFFRKGFFFMKLSFPGIQVQSERQESWFKEEVQGIGSFSSDWEGLTIRNLQFLHKLRPAY